MNNTLIALFIASFGMSIFGEESRSNNMLELTVGANYLPQPEIKRLFGQIVPDTNDYRIYPFGFCESFSIWKSINRKHMIGLGTSFDYNYFAWDLIYLLNISSNLSTDTIVIVKNSGKQYHFDFPISILYRFMLLPNNEKRSDNQYYVETHLSYLILKNVSNNSMSNLNQATNQVILEQSNKTFSDYAYGVSCFIGANLSLLRKYSGSLKIGYQFADYISSEFNLWKLNGASLLIGINYHL